MGFGVSGALLTVGEGSRKGHTKSASISAAATRHADMPPLDTNIDAGLRTRSVLVQWITQVVLVQPNVCTLLNC